MRIQEFNVNDKVRVKLTDHGRAVHRKNHDDLDARIGLSFTYRPPKEDLEGWSEWQMWHLMHEFGHSLMMGTNVPFETTIQLVIKD